MERRKKFPYEFVASFWRANNRWLFSIEKMARHRLNFIFEIDRLWQLILSNTCCRCDCIGVKPKQSHFKHVHINANVLAQIYQWWMKCRFLSGCINNSSSVCVCSSAFLPVCNSWNSHNSMDLLFSTRISKSIGCEQDD